MSLQRGHQDPWHAPGDACSDLGTPSWVVSESSSFLGELGCYVRKEDREEVSEVGWREEGCFGHLGHRPGLRQVSSGCPCEASGLASAEGPSAPGQPSPAQAGVL